MRARSREKGAVNLIIVVVLLAVIGVGMTLASTMLASSVSDSVVEDDTVAALYLAESGLEAAVANLRTSLVCDGAGVGVGGAVSFGRGTYTIQSAAPNGALCRVVVNGAIGNVRRTIQADVVFNTPIAFGAHTQATANAGSISASHTTGGVDRLLLVMMAVRSSAANPVTGITYGSAALTRFVGQTHSAETVRSEIWFLANPPTGTDTVTATLSAAAGSVMHVVSLTGVAPSTPLDTTASASACAIGNGRIGGVTVTTTQAGSWVVDALAIRGDPTPTAVSGQTGWSAQQNAGGGARRITGAASHKSVPTAGPAFMAWTWGPNREWVECAATVLRVGPQIATWTEL